MTRVFPGIRNQTRATLGGDKMPVPTVKIEKTILHHDGDHPLGTLFYVTVEEGNHIWLETYSTELEVQAFVRGLRAGLAVHGSHWLGDPVTRTSEANINTKASG
jgi:hypothetical protein